MFKIKNQNYFCLDPFIDIQKHLSLRHQWEFIASCKIGEAKTGVWNSGGHDPDEIFARPEIFKEKNILYYSLIRANIDRNDDKELDNHLFYFEKNNDKLGLSRYLKLRYGSFDPYNILQLRSSDRPLHAADAYTFSEDDWNSYSWKNWALEFPDVIEFSKKLPFDKLGVVTIFYNEHFVPLGFHRDLNLFPYERTEKFIKQRHRQELIWMRFDLDRPFYLFDIDSLSGKVIESYPINGYTAFFNHHNWHGNFQPHTESSITIKFEGKFTDEFRKLIGIEDLEYYD
jgi:hypothetical protein